MHVRTEGQADRPVCRVAYLVNRYPHPSHTFIRREIAALESLGVRVLRFSIRPACGQIVEEADGAERALTRVLLDLWSGRHLVSVLKLAVCRPVRFARAALLAMKCARACGRGGFRHLAYLAEAAALLPQLARLRVDILHAHFGTNPAAVAMLCRALGGPPWTFTAHGPEEFEQPWALAQKIRSAESVIAVCSHGQERLRRLCHPLDAGRIRLVRCGIGDCFLGGRSAVLPDAPRLVCVARLSRQKGHHVLLRAAAILKADKIPFELTLVGDGERRGDIEAMVRMLDLGAHVRLLGWQDEAGVRKSIEASRALVLPSLAEGLPIVLMEALALRRPVIATTVGGVPELVVDGACGWLVPPGDPEALSGAMRQALTTPRRRLSAMAAAGASCVRALHDVRNQAAELLLTWREIHRGVLLAGGARW